MISFTDLPSHKLPIISVVVYQCRRYDVNYFCFVIVSNVKIYEEINEDGITSVRWCEANSIWNYVRYFTAIFHYNTTSIW